MSLEVNNLDNGIRIVTLTERLDLDGVDKVENSFYSQTTTSKVAVLVDMSSVDFVASLGMRMLITSARALSRRGGKMVLFNLNPLVADVFKTSGIDTLISMHTDYDAACEELLPFASS